MACIDVIQHTCEVWKAAPPVGVAAAGLFAAVLEVPSPQHRIRPHAAAALCAIAAAAFTALGAFGATGRMLLAGLVLATALAATAIGLWLARDAGTDPGDDSGGGGRDDPRSPESPEDGIDWDAFERELRAYAAAQRIKVTV